MSFGNKIDEYSINFYGKRKNDGDFIARINLYEDGGPYLGNVVFYRDGQQIPPTWADENRTPKRVHLKMHERQIDSVIDMLRNEKPCYVHYHSPTWAWISTGREPVGEEESEE